MSKYKININHLDTHAGIHRLERDGFTREQIMKTMYKETDGASKKERTELVSRLFDRQREEQK